MLVAVGAGLSPAVAAAGLAWARGVPLPQVGQDPVVLATLGSALVFGGVSLWIAPLAVGLRKDADAGVTAFLLASVLPGLLALFGLLMTPWSEHPGLWLAGVVLVYLPAPLFAGTLAKLYPPPEPQD